MPKYFKDDEKYYLDDSNQAKFFKYIKQKFLKYAIEMKISEFFKYVTQENKKKCRDALNKRK